MIPSKWQKATDIGKLLVNPQVERIRWEYKSPKGRRSYTHAWRWKPGANRWMVSEGHPEPRSTLGDSKQSADVKHMYQRQGGALEFALYPDQGDAEAGKVIKSLMRFVDKELKSYAKALPPGYRETNFVSWIDRKVDPQTKRAYYISFFEIGLETEPRGQRRAVFEKIDVAVYPDKTAVIAGKSVPWENAEREVKRKIDQAFKKATLKKATMSDKKMEQAARKTAIALEWAIEQVPGFKGYVKGTHQRSLGLWSTWIEFYYTKSRSQVDQMNARNIRIVIDFEDPEDPEWKVKVWVARGFDVPKFRKRTTSLDRAIKYIVDWFRANKDALLEPSGKRANMDKKADGVKAGERAAIDALRTGMLRERDNPVGLAKIQKLLDGEVLYLAGNAKRLASGSTPKRTMTQQNAPAIRLMRSLLRLIRYYGHMLEAELEGGGRTASSDLREGLLRVAQDARLRERVIRLAHEKPELRDALLPLVMASQPAWVKIFDSLRSGQVIQAAFKSVMGRSDLFDGTLHDFKVGRKSVSKKHGVESVTLEPVGRPKMGPGARIRLHKRSKADGSATVSASTGDMGMTIVDLKG